jgi:hypothetical protein
VRTALHHFCFATLSLLMGPFAASAEEAALIPARFTARIGGFLGATYDIELRRDGVSYTKFGAGHRKPSVTIIRPTTAQWGEFRLALDELRVWQWRSEYPNTGTRDGTQWALDIAYGDRALKTMGDNNYPTAAGKPNRKPQMTEAFGRYLAAVEKLLGGKTFK